MTGRTWFGVITGVIYGLAIFYGAVYQGLTGGALIILATAALGVGAGLIAGGLLFFMIAMCPVEEKKHPAIGDHAEDYRAAA